MSETRDVAVLGGGVAGLTAAFHLREVDVEVLEASASIGGRTLSKEFSEDVWANYAAQYLSADKTKMIELADELDMTMLEARFSEADLRGLDDLSEAELAEIEAVQDRIIAEQAKPRDPTSDELDDQTFAEWLGAAPRHVLEYFDHWCSSLMCVSSAETSLYGMLLLWGAQRTTAFDTEPVSFSNRGDVIIKGGTQRLTKALAEASGAVISLDTRAVAVLHHAEGYEIVVQGKSGNESVYARQVICALPAPSAALVIQHLPRRKRAALLSVRYGRFLVTPITIAPLSQPCGPYTDTWCRPRQVYNSNNFVLRTPGDMDELGGCFHSYVYDTYARQIWDDPDHTVKTGVVRTFLEKFPQYENRIREVGIRRWEHGLPVYSPGRMKRQPDIEASVGGIHFCGDYVLRSNTDGAARSGEVAARKALMELG